MLEFALGPAVDLDRGAVALAAGFVEVTDTESGEITGVRSEDVNELIDGGGVVVLALRPVFGLAGWTHHIYMTGPTSSAGVRFAYDGLVFQPIVGGEVLGVGAAPSLDYPGVVARLRRNRRGPLPGLETGRSLRGFFKRRRRRYSVLDRW